MPSLRHVRTTCSRYIRRNFHYICGKIGLTLRFLLAPLFDALDEVGKLQQISHAKGGATGGQDDAGIRGSNAGPGRWQCPDMLRGLVKRETVVAPSGPGS